MASVMPITTDQDGTQPRRSPGSRGPEPSAGAGALIAWRCDAWYEWCQHVALAERAGVRPDAIARVTAGPAAPGWTARQQLLLVATDELHDRRVVSDDTWDVLARELTAHQLIELCFLVGHYEMVAMALNTLGVEPEPTARARLTGAAAAAAEDLRARLAAARRPGPVTLR